MIATVTQNQTTQSSSSSSNIFFLSVFFCTARKQTSNLYKYFVWSVASSPLWFSIEQRKLEDVVFPSEQASQNGSLWSSMEESAPPRVSLDVFCNCFFLSFFFFYKSFIKTDKFILCGRSTLISKKKSRRFFRKLSPVIENRDPFHHFICVSRQVTSRRKPRCH